MSLRNNKMLLKSAILLFALVFYRLLFNQNLMSQSNDSINTKIIFHQVWIDLYPHFYMNDKLEYYGDAGFRTIIGVRSWNRIYARPSLRYHINKTWEVHGGVGIFYIFDKYHLNDWSFEHICHNIVIHICSYS